MRTVWMLVVAAIVGVAAAWLVPASRADDAPIRLAQGVGPLPSPAVNPRLGEERRFTAPAVAPPAGAGTDPAAAVGGRDGVVPPNPADRVGVIGEGHLGAPPLNAVPNPPAGAVPPPPPGAVPPPGGAAGTTNVAPGAPAPVPLGR